MSQHVGAKITNQSKGKIMQLNGKTRLPTLSKKFNDKNEITSQMNVALE